jgi:hypothetical protein
MQEIPGFCFVKILDLNSRSCVIFSLQNKNVFSEKTNSFGRYHSRVNMDQRLFLGIL